MSSQRIGKYACLEIERKYLLCKLPSDVNEQAPYWHITDRYIANTRLRLRRMFSPGTNEMIFKLAQKYRTNLQDQTQATITNLYLSDEEYRCLAVLPAKQIEKRRYSYLHQGIQYSIDVFEGQLAGLIVAETECETNDEATQLFLPSFALKEVTDDLFFAGSSLAALNQETFLAGLQIRR